MFRDEASLGAASEAADEATADTASPTAAATGANGTKIALLPPMTEAAMEDGQRQQPLLPMDDTVPSLLSPAAMEDSQSGGQSSGTRNLGHQRVRCCGRTVLRVRHIPYVIFISDMLISLGAGMTVQFFALFFANDYTLPPITVAAVFVGSPIAIAVFSL